MSKPMKPIQLDQVSQILNQDKQHPLSSIHSSKHQILANHEL